MEKRERKILNNIKNYIKNPEKCNIGLELYIKQNITYLSYDNLLTQKIILKIFLSDSILDYEKEKIYDILVKYYSDEKLSNYIKFIKIMFPIEMKIRSRIEEAIKSNFTSLFLFCSCLSLYISESPDTIYYAKNLLINEAKKVLVNDISWKSDGGKIRISKNVFLGKKTVIEKIYKDAIKCGCIAEKFEDISYSKEEVVDVILEKHKPPYFRLQMKEPTRTNRLLLGSAYYTLVAQDRVANKAYDNDIVFGYYKCLICKRCYIIEYGEEIYEIIEGMLERQFATETMLDYLLRLTEPTGTTVTIVLSILLYLFIELLFLLIYTKDTYIEITYDKLRKEICFANVISDEEFNRAFNIICYSVTAPHIFINNNIIIAGWMYNNDYNVFEEVRNLVLNVHNDKKLGADVSTFGKSIFENIVKCITMECGWKVLESNLKIKSTDFDLLAYKDGTVIMGQIKVAHCDRTPYNIWKAEEIIKQAIFQINKCKVAIEEDENLLYSNLKREDIVRNKGEIKDIIYIVVSGNSYFSSLRDIPILSIEDLKNILIIEKEDQVLFKQILFSSLDMYNIQEKPVYTNSVIDIAEYKIMYDEFEMLRR